MLIDGAHNRLAVRRPGRREQQLARRTSDQGFPLAGIEGINHQAELAEFGVVIHDISETTTVRRKRDVGIHIGDEFLRAATEDRRPIKRLHRLARLTANKIKVVAIGREL